MPATNDTTTGNHGQNARTLHSANAPETSPEAAVSTMEPTTLPRPPHSVMAGSTRECIDALVAAVAAARAERNGDTCSIAPTTLGAMWLALDDVEAALASQPAAPSAAQSATPEMVAAAEEAYMPFGDMELALNCALAAAKQGAKS